MSRSGEDFRAFSLRARIRRLAKLILRDCGLGGTSAPRLDGERRPSYQSKAARARRCFRRGTRTIGDECILVVEDDDVLTLSTVEILRDLGYSVLAAPDGPAALEILDRGHKVDLLFTDVMLPGGMNGRQLADQAKQRRPRLKVLFTTGYTRNAIVHHGRLDLGVQMIGKPFSYEQVAVKVRALLDATADGE